MTVRLRDSCFVSPLGHNPEAVLERLRTGQSAISNLSLPVLQCGARLAATEQTAEEVPHPRLSPRYKSALLKFCHQVRALVERSGPFKQVFFICKDPFFSKFEPDQGFVEVLWELCGLKDVPCLLQAACSTGIVALNWAARELGVGERTLLVGVETELNPEKFVAFKKLGALSQESNARLSCLPFAAERSGLVPGEVMVALLLEGVASPEVGDILLRPGFSNCDASRLTDGLESGDYLLRCLQASDPGEIDFLCPHATSTPLNDALEGRVLTRHLQGRESQPWIVPLKQYLGHTLNSSGLWETLLTAELLRADFLPALLHPPDREAFGSLRFVEETLYLPLRRALKLSIGFGGINAALSLEKS